MDKKLIVLRYLVPFIMVVFFVRNLILVEDQHMDSWMGGGMRMFGKIDKMIYRVAGFNMEVDGKVIFVNLRSIPELEDDDIAARILPNDERLPAILDMLRSRDWCYDPEEKRTYLVSDKTGCDTIINGDQIVNVQVYATVFDEETHRLSLQLINEANED